ncbi:unnamed protein product [Ascophyllum nodosum]
MTDRTRVEAQNASSSRRRRHDVAPVPSPPRGHRVSTSREVEHRSHKRPRSTSPPRTRGPRNGARDGDGYQGGNDENGTVNKKRGREGEKAKKAKRRASEDREARREKKSKKERHSRKQLKKHKQRHRGEDNDINRVRSSKDDKWASAERRRSSSSSNSNSRRSDRGKEDVETPPRSKEEPIGTSGREETKDNGGCELSVLGEGVPVPPAADPAAKPHGCDSRIEQGAVDLDEDAPTPPASPGVRPQEAEISAASAADRSSFFAKLHALEGKKGTVGTVHASGVRGGGAGGGAEPLIKSNDWECLKCGKSNYKNASSCGRCHALKRMTLWRD